MVKFGIHLILLALSATISPLSFAAVGEGDPGAAKTPWYAVARCDSIEPHVQTCKSLRGKNTLKGYDASTCSSMMDSYIRWQCAAVLVAAKGGGNSGQDDLKPKIEQMPAAPEDSSKWLFVFAVENYENTDKVTFAKNSGELVLKAFQKRFGISPRNTYSLIDDKATTAAFLDKMSALVANVKYGDTIYFYYSGHGIPDQKTQEAFILPKDKMVNYVAQEEGLKLSSIYDKLARSQAGHIYAFVDSCFSGRTDNKSNFVGVAPGLFRVKDYKVDSRMTVVSAGKHNQFSNAYESKGHRMFSYFLLKALTKKRAGAASVETVYDEVSADVLSASNAKGDSYKQEPQILGNRTAPLL